MRLERYGAYRIARPDPQTLWEPHLPTAQWARADAMYRDKKWHYKTNMPERWPITYKDLTFYAHLTPFKHTGIFPEQAVMWDWIGDQLSKSDNELPRSRAARYLN